MQTNLFDITEDFKVIINELVENGGELTEDIEQALVINKEQLDNKLLAYKNVIKSINAEIQLAKDTIDEYKAKIKAREVTVERLKERVKMALDLYGEEQVNKDGSFKNKSLKTLDYSIYSVYNKPLILESDFSNPDYARAIIKTKLTNEQLVKVKTVITDIDVDFDVDKTLLKADLERGVEVEGASIDNEGHYIVIR